ncbi:hypothetical protein BT93_E0719 [Corymbia citriodora subsp. variegata]|nr:hypothetical protein BT93_E0719 [Corymbia citriodora subsp. variegata]
MDLETENRVAAILMKEAAELRRQAEKEGALAYLCKPSVRTRPNSRFLSATVLGVQQANKAVEVNEMWRLRQKELELDNRIKGRSREESSSRRHHKDASPSRSSSNGHDIDDYSVETSCSRSRSAHESHRKRGDEGLGDEEIEEFLHSRVKRGRGAIGSRMDETGPYLPSCPGSKELSPGPELREAHVKYGPEKPYSLKASGSPEEDGHKDRHKKAKKVHSSSSRKHSSKHRSEGKSRKKKKERNKHRK